MFCYKQRYKNKSKSSSIKKQNINNNDTRSIILNDKICNDKNQSELTTCISKVVASAPPFKYSLEKTVRYRNEHEDDYDDEHKYHEINDLSITSSTNTTLANDNKNDTDYSEDLLDEALLKHHLSYINEGHSSSSSKSQKKRFSPSAPPPPYNKIHMFKNADFIQIKGKTTCV